MASSPKSSTPTVSTSSKLQSWFTQGYKRGWWQVAVAGSWLVLVASATGLDLGLIKLWERQMQTLFFELRGVKSAPEDIVILAIDDESMSQGQSYPTDDKTRALLAPIKQWPWQRQAYAIAIQRLLDSGAKVVALDVLLTTESSYGPADDQALAQVLEKYGDRVVLGATYKDIQLNQGSLVKPQLPISQFLHTSARPGIIQFPIDLDGRIHRQGREYVKDVAQVNSAIPSFAESVLEAARIDYPQPLGPYIHYYGPNRTFKQIPFWYILNSENWDSNLQSGAFFKDKIVLIGATASSLQDAWPAPFSETHLYPGALPGVEILANDIATLRAGNAPKDGLSQAWVRGVAVLVLGTGFVLLLRRIKRPPARLGLTVASSAACFGLSFLGFAYGGTFLPTASPIFAIFTLGGAYTVTDLITEQIRKQRLRNTLAQYVTSPIVQEIISQQDDFHDLLKAREEEVIGLLLEGRYRVVKLLGSGGFGETYVAEDTQRPGAPTCVVKQLKIISDDPKAHRLARRLFTAEAETLERLGHHNQIPRLLAYFEAQFSFYLVEEMIEGRLLREELASRKPRPQWYALKILQDVLPVVSFVHSQGVIHRDIKPANLIRRRSDNRLVLIDFGAVKQISNKLTDTYAQVTSTIGIGTQGYMPSEQSAGLPAFSSDLYAIGITAIEALTGIPPYALQRDKYGEVIWKHAVPELLPEFGDILDKLVRYDFSERYQSSEEVLQDLNAIAPLLTIDAQSDDQEIEEAWDDSESDELEPSSTCVLPSDWQGDSRDYEQDTVKLAYDSSPTEP
ncbi:MAG TPA: serine/threonine-protein kinase [Trichocoleus sp.]